MRKLTVSLLVAGAILLVIFGLIQVARGQEQDPPGDLRVAGREVEGENVRQVLGPAGVAQPSLSFINSPTPYCFQPNPTMDECYVNWASMSVSASPASMKVMTLTIDAVGIVARYQGFFQEAMTVTHEMNGMGFQVACGAPGAGGQAQLGASYDWIIKAEDINGVTTSNSGTLYCPPHNP